MHGEVVRDLLVRVGVRDAGSAFDVAEERHARRGRRDALVQRGCRDREATALAHAEDEDVLGVRHRQFTDGVDRSHGVGDEADVVERFAALDPAGQEPGVVRAGADGIGGVAAAPRRALPAGVHVQVREARRRPEEVLGRSTPTASVADELDDGGQGARRPGRDAQPGADGLAVEAREGDVVHVDGREPGVDALHDGRSGRLPSARDGLRPERIEVVGQGDVGGEAEQCLAGEVGVHVPVPFVSNRSPRYRDHVCCHDLLMYCAGSDRHVWWLQRSSKRFNDPSGSSLAPAPPIPITGRRDHPS